MIPYRVIVDGRSAALHALYTGTAPGERRRIPETDKPINPPWHGLSQFIINHLKPLLEQHGTLPLLYVWDAENSREIRKQIDPDYKKSRDLRTKTETEVHNETFELIKQLLASLGILQVSSSGMEADDVIAFFAHRFKTGRIIYTRDSDLWQLHNGGDCIVEFIGAKPPYLTDTLLPRHVSLYKALVGDTSDDIPGVKGFGEKAFEKLKAAYGDEGLDELHEFIAKAEMAELKALAEEYDDKTLRLICDQFPLAVRCYQLARLHPEWMESAVGGKIRDLTWYKRIPSQERLERTLVKANLTAFLHDFDAWMPVEVLVDANNIDENLDEIEAGLADSFVVPFDYETYDSLRHKPFQEAASGKVDDDDDDEEGGGSDSGFVDTLSQKITGASFCFGNSLQTVIYLPVNHADTANHDKSLLNGMFESIAEIPTKPTVLAHNAGFEWQVTNQELGINLEFIQDTAIWSSYVDEKEFKGLKKLSRIYLNYTQQTYSEVLNGREDMRAVTGQEVLHYGCDDALCAGHLWHLFTTICEIEGTYDFVMEHEFNAMNEFYHGFRVGIRLDLDEIKEMRALDAKTMIDSEAKLLAILERECSEEWPEGVEEYWKVIYPEQRALFQDQFDKKNEKGKELQHDWVEVQLSQLKAKLLELSKYTPPTQVRKEVGFIPTPAQFLKVTDALELPPIDSVSQKALGEWLMDHQPVMEQVGEMSVPKDCESNVFCTLLGAAVPELKAREGERYAALEAFCIEVLSRTAPMETQGDVMNLASPQQMQALFYVKLGLPVRLRSKVQFDSSRYRLGLPGSPATDKKAIAMAYANDALPGTWQREVLEALSKYKKALKREQSMWRPYPLWVHPQTGNLHASIKGCGTETRRPTSSKPNILQIAKGDRLPPHPRKSIRTLADDFVIVDPDFNGQELRILASECQDPAMLDAYIGPVKKDLHTLITTNLVHHVMPVRDDTTKVYAQMLEMGWLKKGENPTYEQINTWRKLNGDDLKEDKFEERGLLNQYGLPYKELTAIGDAVSLVRDKAGKPTNFLIVYGGGYNTLSQNTAMPVELTKVIIDETLNNVYVRLRPWTHEMVEFARTHGYVQTAYGTRKHVSAALNSKDPAKRSRVERQLVNFLIQGCAADMLKTVLSAVRARKLRERFQAYLMAPVYDEMVYHVHKSAVVDFSMELMECMRVTPPGHVVPMVPELSLGFQNWHDLVGIGADPKAERIQLEVDKFFRSAT